MPHIDLPEGAPGIVGPLLFRPETAKPLMDLAEVLLRADNSLSRGDRELIAAYVSNLNECRFCTLSHSAFASHQLDNGEAVVVSVMDDVSTAPISEKLRGLLAIAAKVQHDGRDVQADDIAAARENGASDIEIHDTVLIAAAFCMYNRYVDGLAAWTPDDTAIYDLSAQLIVEQGYRRSRDGKPQPNQLNLVTSDFDATVAFYRLVGIEIPDAPAFGDGHRHAEVHTPDGFTLEFDSQGSAGIWNAGWRGGSDEGRAVIGIAVVSREEVDARYRTLVDAGYRSRQVPYDTFWGARYAVVADPDGNDVGMMSPIDSARRYWPPIDSPSE